MDDLRTGEAVRIEPASILRLIYVITPLVLAIGYLLEIVGALQGIPASKIPFPFLSLNHENSIPTWWATMLLAIAATLMLLVSALERSAALKTWIGWRWLGFGFLYASLDEAASLHERFGHLLGNFEDPTGGLLTYRWVAVGFAIVLIVGLVFLPLLLRLPRSTAARLIVAGAIFVSGAVGTEMFGGAASLTMDTSFTYQALFMLEETLEMIGAVLAVRALLLHIDLTLGGPAFRIATA